MRGDVSRHYGQCDYGSKPLNSERSTYQTEIEAEADRIRRARKSQMEAIGLLQRQQAILAAETSNSAEQIRLDERLATQLSLEEMASFPNVDFYRQPDHGTSDHSSSLGSSPKSFQTPLSFRGPPPPLPSVYSNFQSHKNNIPNTAALSRYPHHDSDFSDPASVGRAPLNVSTSTPARQTSISRFTGSPAKPLEEHAGKTSNQPRSDRSFNPAGVDSSSSPGKPEGHRPNTALCDQCELEREDVSFCPVCSFNYCAEHWDGQMLHRKTRPTNGVPHEKTNPHVAKQILSIIEPCSDEIVQESLHRADEETTWFGVLPDQAGQLSLHDFGRYEEFLSQSTFSPRSGQYPSLVSFIGKTGVGKSTIVKGLVQLFSPNAQSGVPQTPVVGMPQHQEIPTSGEVHLFWDPVSLHTNRPILYADCEGLGAGSQEPMSARATANGARVRTDRPSQNLDTPLHAAIQSGMSSSLRAPTGWASASGKNFRGVTRAITWAQNPGQHNREYIVENLYPRLLYTFSDIVVLVMRNARRVYVLRTRGFAH